MDWVEQLRGDGDHAVRLKTDLACFAESSLRLRPKTGSIVPFVLNQAILGDTGNELP